MRQFCGLTADGFQSQDRVVMWDASGIELQEDNCSPNSQFKFQAFFFFFKLFLKRFFPVIR